MPSAHPLHSPPPSAHGWHVCVCGERRHIFCSHCLDTWLELKPDCPECRGAVDVAALAPDRLADRLVSNVRGFCELRHAGCRWVGKRGDLVAHMAHECEYVTVACPNDGCGKEMPRGALAGCAPRPCTPLPPWVLVTTR